ncbi:DUF11 domain-containing protein [Deinococcus altitudinis]|uniref:DUF11 domain-containing protein n=1 Tax=Deinococcus altitudinis TaxID=468914 RepID=UPI0038927BF8
MKKSLHFLPLMVALAAGVAGAAGGTTAGTVITNTATITFSDDGGTPQPPVPSNPVTTTVLPVPDFTITPNQTTAGTLPTDAPDYTKPGQTQNAKPGDTVAFQYKLSNTGNVNGESYNLTTGTTPTNGVGGTGTGLTPAGVTYYPASADTNGDGALSTAEITAAAGKNITTISGVDRDKDVIFYQVYTIPTTATDGQTFGSSPTGTRRPNSVATNEPAAPFTQPTDSNNANLTTVKRADAVAIGPKAYPDGNAPVLTYPSVDTTPVTVTETGDVQTAPTTATTTKVTFTNTVKNPGNRPDVFDITSTPANLPVGATVALLDNTGAALKDTDGDGVPDVGTLAPGAVVDIRVEVTLPAGSATTDATKQPTFTVTATSSNDVTKKDSTIDKLLLPGVLFGDKTAGDPDPAPLVNQNAVTPGTPNSPTTSTQNILTSIPMAIKNTGGAPEAFTPVGTITFKTPTGDKTVPVSYLPDANCDGTADSAVAITVTPVLASGATYCLIPVVSVPDNAYPGSYTLNQTATGTTTGVKATDTNDTVTVPKTGTPTDYVKKTVDKASAKPGETLTYTILGINKSNGNIRKAVVSDALPTNTSFVSIATTTTVALPGKVLYRLNGAGAWSATAPTALATGVQIEVGVDSNNDNTIDNNDVLKPGEQFEVTFKVTVN